MRVSSFRRTSTEASSCGGHEVYRPSARTRLLVTGGHGQGGELVDAGGVALGLVGGERGVVPAPCPLVERVAAAEGAPAAPRHRPQFGGGVGDEDRVSHMGSLSFRRSIGGGCRPTRSLPTGSCIAHGSPQTSTYLHGSMVGGQRLNLRDAAMSQGAPALASLDTRRAVQMALLHLVDGWHAEAVANQGIRSPEQARRTRRQLEGVLAPQPRARSGGAEGSAPRHARTARPWHCG